MQKALKAPMNADPMPMPADKAMDREMANICVNIPHSSAAIGVHSSAFIGASKAFGRTKC